MEDREGNGFFPDVFLILDIQILIIARIRARLPSINDQTSEQALLTRTATTTRRSDPEVPFAILHTRLDYPQLASSGSWALVGRPHCRISSVSRWIWRVSTWEPLGLDGLGSRTRRRYPSS